MSSGSASSRYLLSFSGCRGLLCATLLSAALSALSVETARAQNPGDRDPNFLSDVTGTTIFAILPSLDVDTVTLLDPVTFQPISDPQNPPIGVIRQPLSSLVVGGDNSALNRLTFPSGINYPFDFRLNFGAGNRIVYTLVADKYSQDPSRYFVGGLFGKLDGQIFPKRNIFRFNSNFTVDATFDTGQGANDYVTAILPTADGKVVVGGLFDTFNNATREHIVRLNDNGVADGSIDLTFNPGLNIDNSVLALAEQLNPMTGTPNGQILAGGLFNQVNGAAATKLVRINNDGSRDVNFGPAIDSRVNTIVVQPDGKILIGGDFTSVNGVAVSKIARLEVSGALDTSFQASVTQVPSDNVNTVAVYTIVLLGDGRMYVGGNFVTVNGLTRNYIALLNADGSVDTSFDPGTNIINAVQTIYPDPTGSRVYVGETVSRANGDKFPASIVALFGVPPLTAGSGGTGGGGNIGTTVPVPILQPTIQTAIVSVTPKGAIVGGTDPSEVKNGMFMLTRDSEDASEDLVVQLRVGGTFKAADASIAGFPGARPGSVLTYTFPAGETSGVIRVMHRQAAASGNKTVRLTVMNPQDGVTTYSAGEASTAMLHVRNP